MDIFEETIRPDKNLFFESYDSNDPCLGSIVRSAPTDYDQCKYVLLGSPQDIGVRRNKGRVGAAKAPDAIREQLYKLSHPKELDDFGFFDLGNLIVDGTLETIHERQINVVQNLLADNKLPIVLGGGNDISYPDCRAVSQYFEGTGAINIDNHFDVRLNKKRNSGTPYRMLIEEGYIKPNNFVELGCQRPANSYIYKNYLVEHGVDIFYYDQIQENGLRYILDQISSKFSNIPLFWGYDMDSIRAADAPGVSAITPMGLSSYQAVKIAEFAGKHPTTKLFEISEVNPQYDIDGRTARLASLMIFHFITSHLFNRGL